ncbi:type III-B CRISPR module RAMP protein Cmr1 [Dictyobacter arantiisoli]|uniref:CRISPR type III-associated protein domain-containing protein n=1 Tax=Dictyobacter arantiisoli TaxID=2014874 RepID=A0A5A5TJC6_9CHLR|nr:type III-B CRISPR module RAMP protein Cmr1 [Dictyobacter arantiisoli]GCF11711.1 hypothetical protein KDI_52750 [Dictyobacter arantiisoli]
MVQKITFSLQTITPLFLAGADQTQAELRPSAFRGGMRYWYRALVGGIVGTDTEELKLVTAQEAALFGATDAGSVLRIRIPEPSLSRQRYQRKSTDYKNINGEDYLLWSMFPRNSAARACFPSQTTFPIIISAHDNKDDLFKRGLAAFWLLTHLGGIGSRSRRCAGSLQVQVAPDDALPIELSFAVSPTLEALRQQLSEGIKIARTLCGCTQPPALNRASFDVLSASTCQIWLLSDNGKPWQSPEAAMNTIGKHLHDYYRNSINNQQRKIFGLPVQNLDSHTRLPSPLHLSLKKLEGEKYVCVAVLFKTDITIGQNRDLADYEPIKDWIKTCFSGKSACEVGL